MRRFLKIQSETLTLVEVAEDRPHDVQSYQVLFTKRGGWDEGTYNSKDHFC